MAEKSDVKESAVKDVAVPEVVVEPPPLDELLLLSLPQAAKTRAPARADRTGQQR